MRGFNRVDHFLLDFRFAIRQLRKSPRFAGTSIFLLALGLAGAVSIFGLVEAALLQPLPLEGKEYSPGGKKVRLPRLPALPGAEI